MPVPYSTGPAPGRTFRDMDVAERLFYSAFLLLMGVAYLMATFFLYASHRNADGNPHLSVTDIAYTYYGNRSGTRLEAAIRGPMSGYLDADEAGRIVAWLKSGGDEAGYEGKVADILGRRCAPCHSPASGMGLPDLTGYAGVHAVAQVDTGASLASLVRISHIHMFGIGLVLFALGSVFRFADLRPALKSTLLILPFAAIALDVLTWYLTKWDSAFAVVVVATGLVLGLSIAAQILISLYQMWLGRRARPASP